MAISRGLEVWRQPDKTGAACASCHSPDGLELAAFNFEDPMVRRRAYPHVGLQNAERIVRYVQALRRFYGIKSPKDPINDRPLQPGGAILAGDTPEARDLAFAKSLPPLLPRLMSGRIASLADAKKARDEVLKLDLHKLQIGFPLNRISEDRFNGKEHASIANWIADTAIPVDREKLIALQQTYLDDPTDQSLKTLDDAIVKEAGRPKKQCDQLALAKYRALLYYQHAIRMESLGRPSWFSKGPIAFAEFKSTILPNPMWDLAEIGRMYADSSIEQFGFPEDVSFNKTVGPTFADQLRELRLGWYWAGWMMDQGLQRSSHLIETRHADYFSTTLLQDGPYPVHCAFMLTKKLVTQSFVPEAWQPGPQKPHVVMYYSYLVLNDNLEKYEPAAPEHRALFRQLLCNSFRMNLQLLADEIERQKVVSYQKQPTQHQIRLAGEYLLKFDPSNADADAALVARAQKALQAAELKPILGTGD